MMMMMNVKTTFKNVYKLRSCTSETAKISRFVRFAMFCFITTCQLHSADHVMMIL